MAGAGDKSVGKKVEHADWMANLPSHLQKTPLNRLAIPGSHNSFSFHLERNSEVGPDTSQAIRDLVKVFGVMAKDVIHRWSRTQSLHFAEQLRAGIRYFDLRIATKPGSEDIYFIHCLYGQKVEGCLKEMKTFLEEHPKEVIIVDFNHMYAMNDAMHKQFLSSVQDVFGSSMCPVTDLKMLTLDWMWQNAYQVIVVYQDDSAKDQSHFWPASFVESCWANTTETGKLTAQLDEFHKGSNSAESFRILQGVLTPDATYIMSRFSGSLRKDLVAKAGPMFMQWLKKTAEQGSAVNVCIMDFVEGEGFISEVINFNK